MTADVLLRAAIRAGLPATAARVGSLEDRTTWDVTLEAPTAQQRADLATFLATFDPAAGPVLAAEKLHRATGVSQGDLIRALLLFYLRDKLGRNPTAGERSAAMDAFRQAYQDVT